ncbi:DUF4360 domain-containing protein [Pseudobacteriovorax antillogorgiicola]|uniref:DUF4360 domain-containing protein n=1 Tax=Pseudobacteriovorax antillogorgiicola TaxID=1513793 RepID=A0A1Y6CXF9_9BACT|nr:DUF4360 domain-containing protein [Pseudobacteriovorax antillogorgiicola]TCS40924.1 uncharacterized protein DUF4360 [Pseudobacteriovorax antillogorgiicola]SMF84002.1 protein of unknown function [Pseudobacteriovorax antillogorgiicola]
MRLCILFIAIVTGTLPCYSMVKGKISNLALNGSGCPVGTIEIPGDILKIQDLKKLALSEMIAETGDGLTPSDSRKFCQATVDVKVPQGWQYAVKRFDYQGLVDLGERVFGEVEISYYFQGQGQTDRFKARLSQFTKERFEFINDVDPASLLWSPCGGGRALNINMAIGVRSRVTNDLAPYGAIVVEQFPGIEIMARRCTILAE